MADENNNAENAPAPDGKKKLPIKTVLVLVVALLIEGIAISAVFILAKGPEPIKADAGLPDELADQEKEVEVLVIAEKFQNTRTGRSYLYDTEIYVIVRKKYADEVDETIQGMQAQLSTQIATIFRRAEPSYLMEPELATLTRQVSSVLTEKIGLESSGEPYVMGTLIKKCIRIRADM
jgi:flagellar basal body-associated protein FliL